MSSGTQPEREHVASPLPSGGGEAVLGDLQPLPRRQLVLTMGGVMLALFMAALDQTVVGTAIPRIVADLGGFDRFTWVTGAYLVASTTTVPIVGRLMDLYGRKGFYVAGIIIFLVGSVLSGLSQTMNQLIAFRAIQGLGGGVLLANAFVVVGDLFPPAERGKYQGFLAAVFGLSSVIGPTLGGFITDVLSWHWIFYVNLPLGIPIVVLFARFFPTSRPPARRPRLDVAGMATLVMAVVSLLLALSLAGLQYDWDSPQIIGLLAVAATMAAVFISVELRATDPIMPLSMYRDRIVSVSLFAVFGTGFGMFGGIVFIPLFFQGVLGASATSSGSFLTPMMLGIVVGAALSGQLLSRLGGHYRVQALVGIATMASGLLLVARMSADTSFAVAVFNIVVMGVGLGITFPVFTIAVQNAVEHRFLGIATSAVQFYRSIGGALGLALLGSFMASRFASELSTSLSPGVKEALPPGRLAELSRNPQALVNPQALSSLQESFAHMGSEGAELTQLLLQSLRETLASVIGEVFIISAAAAVAAFVASLFLKDVPLRQEKHGPEGGPAPAGAVAAEADSTTSG